MRIIFIIFIFLSFSSVAQVNQIDANGLHQGFWQKKQSNGRLLYEGNFKDGKPVGEWKRYHVGGQIKAIIQYKADSDSAFTQLFDEWGKKIAEGCYLNEKKEGTWVYFSESRLVSEENFNNGIKHGLSRKFYDSGEVLEEADWNNGKQEGNYRVFFKNGEPFMQCSMNNNQRNGRCLSYFQNGKVELEANYKNGLRHGTWKYYDENGVLWYELEYENGKLLNPQVRDSIANMLLNNFEKDKEQAIDPEKYLDDPSEYMMKKNVYR